MADSTPTPPRNTNALVVLFTVAMAGFLNYSGTLDSPGMWKTVSLVVCALILGAPVAGLAVVWTTAKVQEIKSRAMQ